MTTRRGFLKFAATASTSLPIFAGCASTSDIKKPIGRVLIVGGGYGGATAAKYLRMWSGGAIEVLMIERNPEFVSCPMSNLVLGGSRQMSDITRSYSRLRDYGVQVIRDEVTSINFDRKRVSLRRIEDLPYDRLILSPGVDMIYESIPGLKSPEAQKQVLHAWKAGPDTLALRKQLESMRDGGVYVLAIPRAPYRCPPGPYERASQVAHYFKNAKPRSKVLILDANEDVTSKGPLFKAAWRDLYPGIIEYRGNAEAKDIDLKEMSVKTDFESIKGDVLNVLPPMRAGDLAQPLITANNRWCGVDWLTMESLKMPGVHILGDSTLSAPAMPKSGHMANQHGKLAAAAIVELMNYREPGTSPVLANTCYSFVSDKEVIHVSSVHRYDAVQKLLVPVSGAGGVSSQRSELEGSYGWAWAQNIWSDMLA